VNSGEQVAIRPMRPDDYPAVRRLWERTGLPIRPTGRDAQAAVLGQLKQFPSTYLVAERQGRLVGVVLGTHDGRKGWINRLAVHPDHRRQGLARRLLAACERALHAQGIEIIAAFVERENAPSAALFERAGYVADVPVCYYRKRSRPDV
jgi:ribosomal protein S18 acetylase RimI-like enzyme